jgi:hypothetical protein
MNTSQITSLGNISQLRIEKILFTSNTQYIGKTTNYPKKIYASSIKKLEIVTSTVQHSK